MTVSQGKKNYNEHSGQTLEREFVNDTLNEKRRFAKLIKFKLERAQGECLGTGSRRRTRQAAKSHGELQISIDPWMSEWGNPHGEEP